jgi:hypothetical protein
MSLTLEVVQVHTNNVSGCLQRLLCVWAAVILLACTCAGLFVQTGGSGTHSKLVCLACRGYCVNSGAVLSLA